MAILALVPAGCDSSALLGPDAAQGIEGTVTIGPQCPVATPEEPCPDLPYQTTIDILDRQQHLVTTVASDANGKFRVGLEPGIYILVPKQFEPYPVAPEMVTNVLEGVWSTVDISYDTGIR